jgi:hypothetical protein
MTNEELVEEILYKADKKGIRTEVLLHAVKMMDENKNLTFYEAIPLSYSLEKQKLNNNGRPETNI